MFICKYSIYIYKYVIYIYIYIYTLRAHHQDCIFHMRMRPQKRALVAAPFEHKPTDSQTHSPLPNCEETNCNGLCLGRLGRHVARKQARGKGCRTPCGQTPRRPRYPKLLLLKPARRQRITPSHLRLRPYVPITPLNPNVNRGLRHF